MSCRIRWIDELSWDIAILCLSCNLLSLSDSSLHALCSFGQNKLCAVCLHKLSSLYRHSLRHNYYSFIALCCSYSSEPNTGIARSWFDNGCTRLKLATSLRILNHSLSDSILNRASWVKILKLSENPSLKSKLFFDSCKFKKWCLAD